MPIRYSISERGIEFLNNFFTGWYHYKLWFFKFKTYDILIDNLEKFVTEFGDEELKKEDINQYKLSLKSEIVFTFFHLAEALFSLLYYCRKSPFPLLEMKSIRADELYSYVQDEIITGKITDEDIRFVFYNGIIDEEAQKETIVSSIKFIREFLRRVGERFLKYKDVYIEYKHGLRVVPAIASFKLTPENVPDPKPMLERSGDAHIFITTELLSKNGKDEIYKVRQTTVSFDYMLYLRLCTIIFQLLDNLFGMRQKKEKLKPGDQISTLIFDPAQLPTIFKEDPLSTFSYTVDLP